MQTIKDVAQQARYQAMQPGAISERQALDAAIKRAVGSAAFVRSISAIVAEAMTPDDGACVLPPVCPETRRFEISLPQWGIGYEISDGAGFSLSACQYRTGDYAGLWLASEERVDGNGACWHRSFGRMVMDDFGNLVKVQ